MSNPRNESYIRASLKAAIGPFGSGVSRTPLDANYWLPTREEFQQFATRNDVDDREYVVGKHDCENFALSLMAHAQTQLGYNGVGLVLDWSSQHAYNIVVYDDGGVMLFEPQSDSFIPPTGDDDQHRMDNADIVL